MYNKKHIIKILIVGLIGSIPIYAETNMQKGIYNAAEEMIEFDNKMNRAIAEHNKIDLEDEVEKNLINSMINDFKEVDGGYLLKRNILYPDSTKVEVKLEDGMLTISTTTVEKEVRDNEQNVTSETTLSSTSASLFIPNDADDTKMQKSYKNGILEIRFPKK